MMRYNLAITSQQVKALHDWMLEEPGGAPIYIEELGGRIRVGQGDSRATIDPDGAVTDED